MPSWYTISPSPFSIAMYTLWAWWASKKIAPNGMRRMSAWVDCVWIAGVVVLVGDIQWIIACWIRWVPTYPGDMMLLVYSLVRNFSLLAMSLMMSWNMWKNKMVHWGPAICWLWGLNILYLTLWFGLAPGLEWTHWVYALENGYSCWPYACFMAFIVGRIITTLIYWRTWNV